MPKTFIEYLEGNNIYCCISCGTHLSALSQLISKNYRGRHGNAYLFDSAINLLIGKKYRKPMRSGVYIVSDIYCLECGIDEAIGWIYVEAEDEQQKFKQGRFILSEQLLAKQNWIDE